MGTNDSSHASCFSLPTGDVSSSKVLKGIREEWTAASAH